MGIAFLTTVLTQWLMQMPIPEKIDVGYVKVEGQIIGPGVYEAWNPIPVEKGIAAGVPQPVIDKVAPGKTEFSLALVAEGMFQAKRADHQLARVTKELADLKKVKMSFYSDTNADKDLSVDDAVKAGVPAAVAKFLAADGKTFKGTALADAIKKQPDWIKLWAARAKRNTIFKTVDKSAVANLSEYSVTLDQMMRQAKGFDKKTADKNSIMVTNAADDGRKFKVSFAKDGIKAGSTRLIDGDNIMVPDKNVYYRAIWLAVMALLVSAVGITNSMLMSVTERFKEIGTMKCLGAMDSFVVTLFLLEAGMLGICASVLGWVLGFASMVLVAGFTKGWAVVAGISPLAVLATFGFCVFVGMLATMVATIIPAKRAADMPAAMALRSEI